MARYVYALGFRWLNVFFDPAVLWLTRERVVKGELQRQAALEPSDRVLDLGCGSGTLAVMLKQAYPLADISGVDGDGDMVRRARKKAAGREVDVNFFEGLAQSLPFREKTYDLVVSSLFFHHLDRTGKRLALNELRRVLEPGGAILVADWAKPSNRLMRLLFYPVQWTDGFTSTRDHVAGAFPEYFRKAGFESLRETAKFDTLLGTVRIFRATIGVGFQVD